ncbi:MAG: oligosaccharide flippase family protein [Bacteroides sp.]|nr:oligosaccharide flippase family protein [Bacteroides sp.]
MPVDNSKIAKNTIYMYLRLLFTIPLAFYTSRVVLRELGVDDFGIYQAVSGIVTMFTILRSAFDSATQRYYNVALAKNDTKLLSCMFSTSIVVQLLIAAILVIVIEAFGLWFIRHKMQYPPESEGDVYFVFHTMVVSIIFIIMALPFTGMIIAREHMKFYAYLTILDVLLKLGLVFLLIFANSDKLKLYAVFQMSVPIVLFIISAIYFKINFSEVKIVGLSKPLLKEMCSFSGWGLLGNICYSLVNEGVNLLLNVFGGVVANAARGIGYQVRGVMTNVLSTTIMPVRPQATQLFVNKNYTEFWNIILTYSKVLFLLAALMVVPIIIYAPEILQLWLGMQPEYSVIFLQLLMVYTLIRSFHEPLDIVFKASGRMKVYQLTTVVISIQTFILSWIFLKLGAPLYVAFIIFCVVEIGILVALLFKARVEGLVLTKYLSKVIVPCLIAATLMLAGFIISGCIFQNWILSFLSGELLAVLCIWCIGLTQSERELIRQRIAGKISRQ